MWAGHIFTLALLAATSFATSLPPLVASRRAVGIEQRSQWKREILPRDTVVLNYGISPYHPPSAVVTLSSIQERPILLVEDFDHLLNGVRCRSGYVDTLGDTIILDFVDDSAFDLAAHEWAFLQDFFIVTSHPGCNAGGERGAWKMSAVIPERTMLRVTLVVEPVQMRDIVKSFAVEYRHGGANSWTPSGRGGLARRQVYNFDSALNFDYTPSISPRLPLFPPNSSLDDGVTQDVISQLTDADIELTCVDCTLTTNVTIGLDFVVDVMNGTCMPTATQQCFTLTHAAMNLTVEKFEQDTELEIYLEKELLQTGANYKVFEVPVGPALIVPSLIDIGPAVGIEIAFELDITSSINITFGASAHIPDGSFASVSLVNSTGDWDPTFTTDGWDKSGVDQLPFRVNAGELNVTTSVAFAPYAEIAFTILDVGGALRLIENMPKVDVDASLQVSVNRECKPIGTDDFESFGVAFIVGAGLTLSTEAQLVFEKGKILGHGFPDNWDLTLFSFEVPFTPALGTNKTACYVLSDGNVTSNATASATAPATLSGVPAPTGTLVPAQSAIPTWDFNKIESYYSANGQLPTNVNYGQMVQATTVPSNLQAAVDKAASDNATSQNGGQSGGQSGGKNSAPAKHDLGSVWLAVAFILSMFAILY